MKNKRIIVIGGGPAGLLAAGTAAGQGVSTLLLEKMEQPGRKLSITGKGRCNLTNQADLRDFVSHFGDNGFFLYQAFSRFFVEDLLVFLHSLGIETQVERGGRVFPSNMDANEVTRRLIGWAMDQGVVFRTRSRAQELLVQNGHIHGVKLDRGEVVEGTVILATGGASYTGTGSSGDGYILAGQLGHTVIPIRPALVPLKTAGDEAQRLQGLSLRNVRASVWVDGQNTIDQFGEMLFTHFGISGPIILTMSGRVVDALRSDHKVEIAIDLKPALDELKLDARLLRELDAHGKQQFSTMLRTLLPQKMIPLCVEQVNVAAQKICSQISSVERKRLLHWLKDLRFQITGSLPLEAAIITAGGVSLDEVDPRTMQSRIVEGLYFAGELLDVNADTGGYNLQAAFSTGWLAGSSAAKSLA